MKNKKDSGISKMERDVLDLAFGRKKPKTRYEKKLLQDILQDINEVRKKGGQLELPHD
jgi:hypothetical protein